MRIYLIYWSLQRGTGAYTEAPKSTEGHMSFNLLRSFLLIPTNYGSDPNLTYPYYRSLQFNESTQIPY